MVRVARRLHAKHPDLRFPVACYKSSQRDFCQSILAQQADELPIDLYCGATSEIISAADCILMVSGSVSLEVLARDKPAVAMYRGSFLTWVIARTLVHVWYMSLPNLMADKELMPEFPFVTRSKRIAGQIAGILDGWLSQPEAMQSRIDAMRSLRLASAATGGIARAAEALLRVHSCSSIARAA